MQIADVDGVRLQGLLFDAGTVNSAALLTVGTAGSTVSHASNPISVQDVFFRIGGDIAGKATSSLVVNANDTIVGRHLGLARRPRQLRDRRLDHQHRR